jgi:hypothetical protein
MAQDNYCITCGFPSEGLSLLGAYEDSDEEESDSQQTTKVQHNQSADIDSTLANFMAVCMY